MKKLRQRIRAEIKKLRTKLLWGYLLLLALFCIITVATLLVVRQVMIGQIGAGRLDVLRQISERVSIVKTGGITLANLYEYELKTRGGLQQDISRQNRVELERLLDAQKEKYDQVFQHIGLRSEIMFMGSNGFNYASSGKVNFEELSQELWLRRFAQQLRNGSHGEVKFSRSFFSSFDRAKQTYQFAVGRMVTDNAGGSGILMVRVDEDLLENLYAPIMNQGGEVYIYDQDGLIVSHSTKKMLGKQFINVEAMQQMYGVNDFSIIKKLNNDYLLTTYLDEETGWTIVEEIPTSAIFGSLNRVYAIFACAVLLVIGVTLAVALYMSRRLSQPLVRLSNAMDAFGSRQFTPLQDNSGIWEIDHLTESFNHMAVEIFNLMDTVQLRERQKRLLEMNFLRAQINPHFIYNMLFSIRCIVEIGKNEQAAQMISAFTDLLKSTLSVKQTAVSLKEEFETTRKYLVVQKLRYGEKVHFEMDMDPATQNFEVPPLILQPLVENAIFHGLEAKPSADMVVVASAVQEGQLVLTVTDDGVGMNEQTLNSVREKCKSQKYENESSIGISNVHNRIRLNYGQEYGVIVESVPQIGTCVTIHMPIVTQEEAAKDEGSDCR